MIYIRNTGSQPLYEQVYEGIKKDIMDGTLKKGTALMPIRKMAEELQVSRNTVSHAYQQLVSEGYLRAVRGSGYFVDDCPETDEIYAVCRPQPVLQPVPKLRCDFRYESISTQLFPWSKWQKYVHQALLKEECSEAISYAPNKGNDALRENLCIYLKTSRGVNCTPEQIVICAGTQFGLQIIASLLPARQYLLAFEEPGYGGMKKVFALSKFAIEPIQVLDDGMDMDAVRQKQCNLLYVTPSHQFPTGVVTSMEKRLEMLQWAEENDAFIIENDYDNEFGYRTQRVPSIQAMDQNGRVIYISMFTKVLSPSIWCAYFVLPKTLLPVYEKRYSFFNAALPTYHQVALADFIHDGLLEERHMPKLCALRRDLEQALCSNGFTEVTTPVLISKKFLDRMTIDDTHPLNAQVFWVDQKTCLRPMLAPNLYDVSKRLMRVAKLPLRVFEIGACFRKESEGRSHLREFTMLNLVEWGTPEAERIDRLKTLGDLVLQAAGIQSYRLEREHSAIYGDGLDIVSPEGLERLLMYREKAQGIHRFSKSIAYLDGARLNIK